MPSFVIHWHAYFPTGLFYLLPGPCLPCSKFDVSGYQFIPTWNKEKFMVRDKQQHHTMQTPHLSTGPHLSLQQLGSIPHCPPGFLSHPLGRHCVCNGLELCTALCWPTCRDVQAERHLLGQQHDLSCWGSCKGWAPLLCAPAAPGVVVLSANHPHVPAPLHAPILQGGQQDLSLLPGSLLQRWKSLSQWSSLSITPLTPLTRVPALSADAPVGSTRCFVIQSSVSLGNVKCSQVSKMAIWLFFSHTSCYLMQTNIFYPNNFLPKHCWHEDNTSFMRCPVYFHDILCFSSMSCNSLNIHVQQVLSYRGICIQHREKAAHV